jgi:glycosyltransferase involved in cell wall biosynthesis
MNKICVFLGIGPQSGGMFQYTRSILDGLELFNDESTQIYAAYIDPLWKEQLSNHKFVPIQLSSGGFGLRIALALMALRISVPLSRKFTTKINPLYRQLAELNCDLYLFPAQDALSYQLELPIMTSVHDLMHRYEPFFPEVSKVGRYKIREHRFHSIAHQSQSVLVDSKVGLDQLVECYGVSPDKVHALPYIAPSYIMNLEPIDFDQRYKLPPKFIFYPAQFWEHKNHRRLIDAAVIVAQSCPDLRLVFAGGAHHQYDSLVRYGRECGLADKISFPGYIPDSDLSGFYKRARALIMPSFFGPTNIPPLEAFACGCPVAVSNIYGMAEQSRGAALLFDPTSTEEIAAVMHRLWIDDHVCKQLSEMGYRNHATWNLESFGRRLYEIISKNISFR